MTREQILAQNAGVALVSAMAAQSSNALKLRLAERSTRFSYAIEALDAIVDEARGLMLSLPPDRSEPEALGQPKPIAPTGQPSLAVFARSEGFEPASQTGAEF